MTRTAHVLPRNDLIEHDSESDECLCGPTVKPFQQEDGSMNWVIVHHSLDGRAVKEGRKRAAGEVAGDE